MTAHGALAAPRLSVVVVRFVGGNAIDRTLDALAGQDVGADIDVVVAHRVGEGATLEQERRHPRVRWVAAEEGAAPARLRTVGVLSTKAPVVACTEDHCIPAPDWCRQVLAAQAKESAIIGGAIDKVPTEDGVAWAAYLLDYARYMSPLPAGPAPFASDCNVSYRRADLDAVVDAWTVQFHETTVNWALGRRGVLVHLNPAIIVQQHREVTIDEYFNERVEHGRIFAVTRIAGRSALDRMRFAATAALLPAVIVLRIRNLLRARGRTAAVPSSAWRPLTRAAVAWSIGELSGYVTGR